MQNDLFYEKTDTKIISLNTVHNQIYFIMNISEIHFKKLVSK